MSLTRISNNVYNVGVLAPFVRKSGFNKNCEYGTIYNSYFIDDRKTALIDMVHGEYTDDFLYNLGLVADIGAVDYLILNRVQPQHSDSIKKLLKLSPKTIIVCSEKAKQILDHILNMPYNCVVVSNGDKLRLGNSILEFITGVNAPTPDCMCTYFENDCVLFSGGLFATDFCDPKIIDEDLIYENQFYTELKNYFNYYLLPYKNKMSAVLSILEDKQIYCLAPSNGLIISDRIQQVFESYKNWCNLLNDNKAVVLYASASGSTKQMANAVYDQFKEKGINTEIIDMQSISPQVCAEKIQSSAYIAAGSCTVNKGLPNCVWNALSEVNGINNENKKFFTFGSYGWSGEGTELLCTRLLQSGMKQALPPVKVCMNPTSDTLQGLKNAVNKLIN